MDEWIRVLFAFFSLAVTCLLSVAFPHGVIGRLFLVWL